MAELTLPDGRRAYAPSAEDALAVYREIFDSDDYGAVAGIDGDAPLIVDVGANVGLFCLYAKLAKPGAAVYAFEPIPEIFDAFQRNVAEWGLRDVVGHRLAVGREAGEAVFTYFPHQPADSTRYPADKQVQREYVRANAGAAVADHLFAGVDVTVPVTTLGAAGLPHRRIDLLKVDVEGAELDVLKGMGEELWRRVDRIVVEVHDTGGKLGEVCAELRAHDFGVRVSPASELPSEYGLSMVTATANG